MALVLLPELPHTARRRATIDVAGTLPQLRLVQVDNALSQCSSGLTGLRQAHLRNEERRQEALVREQNRARRREVKQERIRRRHYFATKLQALVRSHFVRRFVLPQKIETKESEELEKSRVALTDTMLGLHQNIHDLSFLDEDRDHTATRIQAWWRSVLSNRVVAIIVIRHHLNAVSRNMDQAATGISAMVRGRQARQDCDRLRTEREARMRKARRMQSDRMLKSVIKIQSHCRRRRAIMTTQARRAYLAKELESDGNAGAVAEARAETSRKPASGPTGRRKRNAVVANEAHGTSTNKREHHDNVAKQGMITVDPGTVVIDTDVADQRRKSYGANVHKAKSKIPRKWQAEREAAEKREDELRFRRVA